MKQPRQSPKTLGIYLLVLAAYQAVLYGWPEERSLFSFLTLVDPRQGYSFLLDTYPIVLSAVRWLSTALLFVIGILFLRRKLVAKTYIATELVIAAPTILWSASLLFAYHGLEAALWGILWVIVYTIVPVRMAFRMCRAGRNQE